LFSKSHRDFWWVEIRMQSAPNVPSERLVCFNLFMLPSICKKTLRSFTDKDYSRKVVTNIC
ncbi:MAG: hypothetical protein ACXVNN_05530, partial [Bacteroidia bacterium]